MDRIECLSVFVNAMESGSFSAAAHRLGITQPTVSKRIASLEQEFGVRLFMRSTRVLAPTEEAERLYGEARTILELYNEAQARVRDATPQPRGNLRIALPTSLGRNVMMGMIAEFTRLYPEVSLDIRLSERQVNLIEEGIELALRIGELKASSIRARRLGTVRRHAVASAGYLHGRATPRDPDDLATHLCIGYSRFSEVDRWAFESENGRHVVHVDSILSLNDADTMLAAVQEGLGIAILPAWLVEPEVEAGNLEIVMPNYTVPSLALNAIYPETSSLSLRARRFLDFLIERREVF